MKKVIKLISLVLVIVMCATLGLAGCGGNKNSKEKTVNEKGQVVVRVSMQEGSVQEQTVELLKKYQADNTNMTFKVEPIVGEYTSKLITQASAGTAPDIVWVSDVNVRLFASKNLLEDISKYYKTYNFDSEDVYESMLRCGQYEGKQYMIPRDFNQVITYYDKRMFDEVGVAYPKDNMTWDEFIATASKFPQLSNSGKTYLRRGAQVFLHWGATAPIIFVGLGGTLTNDGFKGDKAQVNTPETIKVLTELKNLCDTGVLVNDFKNDISGFSSGKVAMVLQTRSSFSGYSEAVGDDKLGTTTFPVLPEKHMVGSGCSGFAVMADSKCKEEAAGFVLYVSSKEGQEVFMSSPDCVPVLKSLANSEVWRSHNKNVNNDVFVQGDEFCVLQSSLQVKNDQVALSFDSAWKEMFSSVLTGVYDVEKAAKYGQTKMEQCFADAE